MYNRETQHKYSTGHGSFYEFGTITILASEVSVLQATTFGTIMSAEFKPVTPTGDRFAFGGFSSNKVITDGQITVHRSNPITMRAVVNDALYKIGNNWSVLLGTMPCAGILSALRLVQKTAAGGTPKVNLGTIEESDKYITAVNSILMPAADTELVVDLLSLVVGAGADRIESRDLAIDEAVNFTTSGGGSSDPVGLTVEVDILPAQAVEYMYRIEGR